MNEFEEFGLSSIDSPDSGPSSAFSIQEYLRLLLGRWKLIAGFVCVCVALALVQFFLTPAEYLARATVQIEQRRLLPAGTEGNPWLEAWASIKYYPTQYRLLESRGLAERVVLDLRLAEDPEFNPGGAHLLPPSTSPGLSGSDADGNEIARLANRLLSGISVDPVRDTELVDISYVSNNPALAARVVNGLAEAFIDWGIEIRSENVGKASTFLTEQIATMKREIDQKEAQLQSYSRNSDILNLDPASNVTLQRLSRLNQDYSTAIADRLEQQGRYNELLSAPKETVADRESTGLIKQLRSEQISREREYEKNLQTYKPDWPAMLELKAQIENGRANLEKLVTENFEKVRKSTYAEYQTALRRERNLIEEIEKTKSEAMDVSSASVEFKNLEMEIVNRRELLDELMGQLSSAGVSAQLQNTRESNVRVVDRALVPTAPFRPSLSRNLGLGVAVGFFLGIGLILLIHFLDRTIKSGEELEKLLGLPVLAVIPDVSDTGTGYGYRSYGYGSGRRRSKPTEAEEIQIELLPETRPRLSVSEAYRSLRTALLLSSASELKVLTVTSAEAGEGKTATATNIAVVMAQVGKRVLLVDADLRKARLHRVFGISNRVGLVSYLTGGAGFDEIVLPTEIQRLSICPSGPHPPNPSELLASDNMEGFLEAARSRFDLVVIDTPPLLAVTDAVLPGARSDGVVLCFRANKVLREDALAARDRLRFAEVKILGTVLNRYRPSKGASYGRKYYYYESYGTDEPATTEADSAA